MAAEQIREPTVDLLRLDGHLYGPGTGADAPRGSAPLHVDAAAWAAVLAIDQARPGIFNIAETNGAISTDKARRELGWDPGFRLASRGLHAAAGADTAAPKGTG